MHTYSLRKCACRWVRAVHPINQIAPDFFWKLPPPPPPRSKSYSKLLRHHSPTGPTISKNLPLREILKCDNFLFLLLVALVLIVLSSLLSFGLLVYCSDPGVPHPQPCSLEPALHPTPLVLRPKP